MAESTIGYASDDGDEGPQLLASAPIGSDMDRALKANLRKLAATHAGTPLGDRVADVLAGKLTIGGLSRSTEFAPIMTNLSQQLSSDIANLTDEQKDNLRRGEVPEQSE